MAELVAAPELVRSPQLIEFLEYVVEKTLAGEGERLKAYSIATDVFGRSASFDPQTDASVRVQAGRLRKALDAIYMRNLPGVSVRIDLPVGRYVPSFEYLAKPVDSPGFSNRFEDRENVPNVSDSPPAAAERAQKGADTPTSRPPVTVVVLAIVIGFSLLVLLALPLLLASWTDKAPEQLPVLIVSTPEASDAAAISDARILRTMLVSRLSGFDMFDIRLSPPDARSDQDRGDLVYRLGGSLRFSADDVTYRAVVSREANSEVVWSHSFFQEGSEQEHSLIMRNIADRVSAGVGAANGAVQMDARAHLPDADFAGEGATAYACQLLFRDALGFGRVSEAAAARRCYANRRSADPGDVIALAALGALDSFDVMRRAAPGDNLAKLLQAQAAAGADAARKFPDSSFAHELYGYVLMADANKDGAEREFLAALAHNGGNTDAAARLGIMLALDGKHAGQSYVEQAIARTPWPSGWYFTVRALASLRHADYASAVRHALTILPDDPELGLAVLVAAAPGAARSDLVDTYLPFLLNWQHFRAQGIIPRLSVRIGDLDMLEALRIGLIRAGIGKAQLSRPYAY